MKPKVIVVAGPTASGKSDIAVELAKQFDGEVISADSRQVYTGLDIGSGKITEEEMQSVPHHLLDVASPQDVFTVADFKQLGKAAIEEILSQNKVPIIAGGTGFYIDTLVYDMDIPEVPENTELRAELNAKTTKELFAQLETQDPERAETIDPENKVRLIRALEIVNVLGKVPPTEKHSPYDILWIGLDWPKDVLDERIYKRLIDRIKNGMIEEVQNLHKDGLPYERMETLGLEYRYVARFLQNEISKEELISELTTKIRQYAKRQRTWFKRNEEIQWFVPTNVIDIENKTVQFLRT